MRNLQDEINYEKAAEKLFTLINHQKGCPMGRETMKLSHGEKGMLAFLQMHPEGITSGQIGKACGIGSGGVANMLNNLQGKGYIARTMNPKDRRSVIVTLTKEGNSIITQEQHRMRRIVGSVLSELGEEDTRELLRIYERISEICQRVCEREEK